jgi:hypothetical protein
MIHPITFSIPESKIVKTIPNKTKMLSDIIPGTISTYTYNTEEEYYKEYQQSYFAITHKKSGWDCMRHYEIMANGCIPVFVNIEKCPPNTMALFPKHLLLEGNDLHTKIGGKSVEELTDADKLEWTELMTKMLNYMKEYLTTAKIGTYIMSKLNRPIKRLLYLSGNISPDYLRCLTLHGLKSVFSSDCHDYPKIPHIYKSENINYGQLYGRGFSYTNLLEQTMHDNQRDATIEDDIKNKYYDIVIYGSVHRGMPYYDLVRNYYNLNDIILLCGEDIHNCNNKEWSDVGHTVFVREL